MKNKSNLQFLLTLIFFSMALLTNAQNNLEKEKKIARQWQLISDAQCDRCMDYIPTEILIANFKSDYTCSGVIIGKEAISYAKWTLTDNKLIITYTDNSGYKKQKNYKIGKLDDTSLTLWQDTFGGSSRKFKVFN